MTERGGRISRLNTSTGVITPLLTINEVESNGEGGLLGMALHPDFSSTPHVFVVYNYDNGSGYKEKVIRYTYNGTTLTSPTLIFDNIAASSIHNGSRIAISPDHKLFISTGDASDPARSQTESSPNGKILRLNLDGTIPSINPVAGNPYWSWGHRNPQGLVFANNKLYSSEHGPNTMMKSISLKKAETMVGSTCRAFVISRMSNHSASQIMLSSRSKRGHLPLQPPGLIIIIRPDTTMEEFPFTRNVKEFAFVPVKTRRYV
jgi:hypothetical protein